MEIEKLYDHATGDAQAQELWTREKVHDFVPANPEKVFSIDTPPPTVSGSLHIGHIFSYTHADLIARYKRMRGYHVFYPMGFDDNGLPTERFVEKKHNTRAHLMKRSEFIDLCLRETTEVEKLFENLWRRMGLSIDWSKTYSTISKDVRRVAQYSFIDLYNKGLVYRKQDPSLYCTTCRTSVAQAELESAEVTTTFNDIVFITEEGEKLIISTTRPELLPSCVALFFNPDDVRYKHLLNKFAITPVFEKPVRIMADQKVDPANYPLCSRLALMANGRRKRVRLQVLMCVMRVKKCLNCSKKQSGWLAKKQLRIVSIHMSVASKKLNT
jgi:valyl-tRNA synthetase